MCVNSKLQIALALSLLLLHLFATIYSTHLAAFVKHLSAYDCRHHSHHSDGDVEIGHLRCDKVNVHKSNPIKSSNTINQCVLYVHLS